MARPENSADNQMPEAESPAGSAGLLMIVWRRKLLIVCLALAGTGLGYLYFLRCPPVYQSTAQVLIIKKDTGLPVQGAEAKTSYDDSLSMHTLLLRSPTIAARAIEKQHLGSLPSLHGNSNPIGVIVAGLGVDCKTSGSTSVLTLTFRGGNDQDCPKILDAIVKTYQEFLGENYQNYSEETAQLITKAKDELLDQLQKKETAYQEFRQKAPLLWKGDAGANLHESRMAEIEANRSRLMVAQSQTRAKIDGIESAVKKGNHAAIAMLVNGLVGSSMGSGSVVAGGGSGNSRVDVSAKSAVSEDDAMRAAKHQRIATFQDLVVTASLEEQLALEEYGPDHPHMLAIRKKLDFLRNQAAAKPDAAITTVNGKPIDLVATYVEVLREELALQAEEFQALDELFQKERESARSLAEFQIRDESLKNEISRSQQLFNVVIKRLDEINLLKDAGGVRTNVVSAPGIGWQVEPKMTNLVGLGAFFGALVGFGLAWIVEVLDKRFRAPDEIRASLGLPILGHIPLIDADSKHHQPRGKAAAMAPVLCVAHHRKGQQAEAYRTLRTTLFFSAQGDGLKIIQVTSPNPGDGKTTTAANLALSMADAGKKILLVDADFRRPRVHKIMGVSNSIGLWGVIEGELEISEATQNSGAANLDLMTSGGRPSNPAELLTSARFKDFLDVVRERYDFVIVDTPPVLPVTDASAVAPRVDAVLLVIQLTKNSRATARHATETLTAIGGRILGIVVNGLVTGSSYGYGYGGYRYGYGGSYKYGYGQPYGYGQEYAESSNAEETGETAAENGGDAASGDAHDQSSHEINNLNGSDVHPMHAGNDSESENH